MTRQPVNKIIFLLALICLVLGACGGGGDTAVSTTSPTEATANALASRIFAEAAGDTNTVGNADFQRRFETAKTTWESHNINDYTVTVRYNQPGWNTQTITP